MPEPTAEAQDEIVLAVLLRHPEEAAQLLLNLPMGCFTNPVMATCYEQVHAYIEENGVAPTSEILKARVTRGRMKDASKWGGVIDRIFSIEGVEEHHKHLQFYVGELEDQWMATQTKATVEKTLDLLDNRQVRDAVRAMQDGISIPTSGVFGADVAADFDIFLSDYEKRRADPARWAGINIGLPSIDAAGGHAKKELWCVTAGAGVGKSLFLGQVAVNVATNAKKKTLLVTVENDLRSYMLRLYSNLCGIPFKHLKNSCLRPEEIEQWISGADRMAGKVCLKVAHFPDGCSTRDISSYMKSLKEPMEYLVVDQITNMLPNHPKDFRNLDFRWFFQIALELKRLADTANHNDGIPLLTAIHAAGGTTDKEKLTTDDIALAKAISYHVHAQLYITRPEEDYKMGASKFRDSKIEPFPVYPRWEYWRLAETPSASQFGNTIDDIEEDHTPPASEPATISGDTSFDPEKIEAERSAEIAVASMLNEALGEVPDSAEDEKAEPPAVPAVADGVEM